MVRPGNCRSTAWTTRVAVSPVASEMTWSSTVSVTPGTLVLVSLARDLREIAEGADRVSDVQEKTQAVRPDGLVFGHDVHLVEEPVDRGAELGRGFECRAEV